MTTQQIQYIIAITEEGSFSAAAKKLVVTQPSISQLVKNIEYTIGAPLFDRTTQPIKLTPVGIAYYEAAKKIENVNRELQNRVSEIMCDCGKDRHSACIAWRQRTFRYRL